MSYAVKELFYTLQGEGANAGHPAVFCRFAGCNLWTGHEEDRAAATCRFCDTDFVGLDGPGGGRYATPEVLAQGAADLWPGERAKHRLVVCTGGEPLLQLDPPLIDAFHRHQFRVAVETNGTILAPAGLDWVCVSPKARATLLQVRGQELKLVFPQESADPSQYEGLDFQHFYLQPMDGTELEANIRKAVEYCLAHPQWRLSLQTHKLLGIP